MNDRELDNVITDSWERANWALDEEWVRAAADLEAQTGVDFLIGADLGNNLDTSAQVIPEQIGMVRLSDLIEDGSIDLLSPAQLSVLITDTRAYINDRVQQLRADRSL
jgi:hypothetical protein